MTFGLEKEQILFSKEKIKEEKIRKKYLAREKEKSKI